MWTHDRFWHVYNSIIEKMGDSSLENRPKDDAAFGSDLEMERSLESPRREQKIALSNKLNTPRMGRNKE